MIRTFGSSIFPFGKRLSLSQTTSQLVSFALCHLQANEKETGRGACSTKAGREHARNATQKEKLIYSIRVSMPKALSVEMCRCSYFSTLTNDDKQQNNVCKPWKPK